MKKILLLICCIFTFTACDSDSSSQYFGSLELQVNGLNGAYLANIEFTGPSDFLNIPSCVLDWSKNTYNLESGTYKLCATNVSGSGEVEVFASTDYIIYRKTSSTTACITFRNE